MRPRGCSPAPSSWAKAPVTQGGSGVASRWIAERRAGYAGGWRGMTGWRPSPRGSAWHHAGLAALVAAMVTATAVSVPARAGTAGEFSYVLHAPSSRAAVPWQLAIQPATARADAARAGPGRPDDPAALTAQLDRQLCSLGQLVDFRTYPGVTHDRITFASRADVIAWIKARFAGQPTPGNCPPAPGAGREGPGITRADQD